MGSDAYEQLCKLAAELAVDPEEPEAPDPDPLMPADPVPAPLEPADPVLGELPVLPDVPVPLVVLPPPVPVLDPELLFIALFSRT